MRTRWMAVIVAAPPILTALLWIWMLLASATGTHPVWRAEPRSLREAAALRDAGAVVRFMQQGERLSPAEAAAATPDQDIVRLILDETVSPNGAP